MRRRVFGNFSADNFRMFMTSDTSSAQSNQRSHMTVAVIRWNINSGLSPGNLLLSLNYPEKSGKEGFFHQFQGFRAFPRAFGLSSTRDGRGFGNFADHFRTSKTTFSEWSQPAEYRSQLGLAIWAVAILKNSPNFFIQSRSLISWSMMENSSMNVLMLRASKYSFKL